MKSSETLKILKEVESIAIKAGEKLVRYQKKLTSLTINHKDAQGVVSEADVETEKFIIKNLKKIIPTANFLGEEDYFLNHRSVETDWSSYQKEEWLWVIDPLDGTSNFLSGMTYYCVCICLLHKGKPFLSVVHRPEPFKTYKAVCDNGAWINVGKKDKKIILKESKVEMKNSLLATGFATEKGELFDREFDLFKNIMGHCRGVRRLGSAALDMCLVAEGVFQGFWERGLAPWDMAASGLIAKESGIKISTYKNEKYHPFVKTICLGRGSIHKSLIRLLK